MSWERPFDQQDIANHAIDCTAAEPNRSGLENTMSWWVFTGAQAGDLQGSNFPDRNARCLAGGQVPFQ
jgi:hypothetical protein